MEMKKLFGTRLGGRTPVKPLTIPAELISCWQGSNFKYRLTEVGVWSLLEGPCPWSVSQDGQTLFWCGRSLTRISGEGRTIVGVWSGHEEGAAIHVHFEEDGRFIWKWVQENEQSTGLYCLVGNMVTVYETRATVSVRGNIITFSGIYGGTLSGPYTVDGTRLHIDFSDGPQDFIRIACPC